MASGKRTSDLLAEQAAERIAVLVADPAGDHLEGQAGGFQIKAFGLEKPEGGFNRPTLLIQGDDLVHIVPIGHL